MTGPRPPRVVFDVGASYGLHSLKHLAHGARVISFEPNPACHRFLEECCERNGLRPEIHAVAVGDSPGRAELVVPGEETYLGTVCNSVKRAWHGRADVTRRLVPQLTLDAFAQAEGLVPDLVKIDVEGGELAVLEGARGLLRSARPKLVFECWPGSPERRALFLLLASHGYRLRPLLFPDGTGAPLPLTAFQDSPVLNFVAHPAAGP